MEVIYLNEEGKPLTFKEKVKRKATQVRDKVADFYQNNKQLVITSAPVIIVGITKVATAAMKSYNLGKEEDLKDRYIYDRSHGHYYEMRRTPSQKEWAEIDRRKDDGESIVDILDDMRLLK
jgi:hypothetical protein